MSKFAVSMGSAQIPCAFITGSIFEEHGAATVTESIQPLAVIGGSACSISVLLCFKGLSQLGLIRVEEEVQFNHSSLTYRLHLILNQEVGRLLSAFLSALLVFHAHNLAAPVCLDLDDPINVRIELVFKVVVCVVAGVERIRVIDFVR